MSKTISLECSDSASPVVIGVLKQLEEVGKNGQTRTIRIGGDEKVFGNGIDTISNIMVDGVLDNTPYTPSIPTRKRSNTVNGNNDNSDGSDGSDGSNVVDLSTAPVTPATPVNTDDTVIAQVIKEYTDANKMFTAFDISREAIKRGVNQKHGQIKRVVHGLLSNTPNYTRSLIAIDNVKINPFLYYPDSADPATYFVDNNLVGCVVG
jgi:hypothetical protein